MVDELFLAELTSDARALQAQVAPQCEASMPHAATISASRSVRSDARADRDDDRSGAGGDRRIAASHGEDQLRQVCDGRCWKAATLAKSLKCHLRYIAPKMAEVSTPLTKREAVVAVCRERPHAVLSNGGLWTEFRFSV